ncbi:MAG: TonB family protein [Hyphomicrobium sp.]
MIAAGDAGVVESGSELIGAGDARIIRARAPDRAFRNALAVAVLLHVSLFLSALGANTKRLGEETGSDDAINVSLVTEADFLSRTTVPEKSDARPGAAAPPQPQQSSPPPQPEIVTPEPPPPVKPDAEPPKEADAAIENVAPDLFAIPDPATAKKKSETPKPSKDDAAAKPSQKPAPVAPPQKTAKLDLTTPPPSLSASPGGGGRSAGFSRPPGITRSGANDDFARAVIRALQQTMPQLRETRGRVTVRIFLNENGNVKEIEITRPSPDSNLNQSVAFAARQTSYPFPPYGSNVADRTFIVTYIYN